MNATSGRSMALDTATARLRATISATAEPARMSAELTSLVAAFRY
jgi:hypothetical protein